MAARTDTVEARCRDWLWYWGEYGHHRRRRLPFVRLYRHFCNLRFWRCDWNFDSNRNLDRNLDGNFNRNFNPDFHIDRLWWFIQIGADTDILIANIPLRKANWWVIRGRRLWHMFERRRRASMYTCNMVRGLDALCIICILFR